ncbi:hypothetical protein [Paenibacillus dakarensis]|uniref:hypothetical protein n=1 Tax=Paenibacillus dakarensis TaxID=1527293 RepID=UPI0006D57BC0|nr:hypothetical protein [Paenibacillus dakarensis]
MNDGLVKIQLTPEQRFLMESESTEYLILVDEISFWKHQKQITFSGKCHYVDYEESKLTESKDKHHAVYDLTENTVYSDEG